MRKTYIVLCVAFMVAATINAQQKAANFPGEKSQLVDELRERMAQVPSVLQMNQSAPTRQMAAAFADTINDPTFVGYTNPRGTYFLGLDEQGTGNWLYDIQYWLEQGEYSKPVYGVSANGVIGAWSDTIPCWVWSYKGGDYKKVQYQTGLSYQYPNYVEDEYYATDAKGNFHDSIVSAGGWKDALKMGYDGGAYSLEDVPFLSSQPIKILGGSWQSAVPMQYVTLEDGTVKRYQMLRESKYWDEPDLFDSEDFPMKDFPLAIGGLPNAQTQDGLWPLTQAEPINANGTSFVLGVGSNERTKPYYFGTYSDSVPQQIITVFDKPQAPLYIESITLPVGAQGYTNVLTKKNLKINQILLEIKDMQGQVLASVQVSGTDKYNVSYKQAQTFPVCMLKFPINNQLSGYGENLQKGILLSDSFQVVLSGFKAEDDFALYAAKTTHHASNTRVIYSHSTQKCDYEPYIMLNGIMPTWEPYSNYKLAEQYGYKTGVRGDTIDINFVTAQSPYYKYIAHYAGEDYASGSEFDFYSSFVPYDSITRLWNLDIEAPNYITIGAGYEENVGSDEKPVLLWDYLRLFWMKLYATEMPVIGDYIKVGKCGRYTYFHIVSIDGGTTPQEIADNQNKQHQSILKTLDSNCQIRIINNGQQYTILGTKIQ